MAIVPLTPSKVVATCVDWLGLDSDIADFETPEVLAEALRRAASFICPTSPRTLVRTMREALRGLVPDDLFEPGAGSPIRQVLDDLVAHGDLIEAPINDEDFRVAHRVLFLGPPSYVAISPTKILLLGVRSEGVDLIDEALSQRVQHQCHVRSIDLNQDEDPTEVIGSTGLRELSVEQWLAHPPVEPAKSFLFDFDRRVDSAGPSGSIDGFSVIHPMASSTYYRGRWRPPTTKDSGRFVGRRRVEYGADLWCYAELMRGEVTRLVDLPVRNRLNRGCDEAWRLQSAIDHAGGRPQRVLVQRGPAHQAPTLLLFSPVPSWAQRYLESVGRPIARQRGSLQAFSVAHQEVDTVAAFLSELMWIQCNEEGDTNGT